MIMKFTCNNSTAFLNPYLTLVHILTRGHGFELVLTDFKSQLQCLVLVLVIWSLKLVVYSDYKYALRLHVCS